MTDNQLYWWERIASFLTCFLGIPLVVGTFGATLFWLGSKLSATGMVIALVALTWGIYSWQITSD